MAIATPFHERTSLLCASRAWTQWSGYFAAASYGDFVQPEYAAIRNSAAVIDVSPLYKYEVSGPAACAFLDRLVTHDVASLAIGHAMYTPWCDPDGSVRQEGTLFRLGADRYQLNAAEPALAWLEVNLPARNGSAGAVTLDDRTTAVAALSVQGPRSRRILAEAGTGAVTDLRFFGLCEDRIGGVPVTVSRTGYTGDLGYELWMPADGALAVWDALFAAGESHGITPCGLQAMDIARLESGFILINVDYVSSERALLRDDRRTPHALGLGWAVKLDKAGFVGREALLAETRAGGPPRRIVGIEIPWRPLEAVYLGAGLMPDLPQVPCREPVPVYGRNGGAQIGHTTTRVWSTLLKRYIALATVEAAFAAVGTEVEMEVTVHHERRRVPARVRPTPFFRPDRMRS